MGICYRSETLNILRATTPLFLIPAYKVRKDGFSTCVRCFQAFQTVIIHFFPSTFWKRLEGLFSCMRQHIHRTIYAHYYFFLPRKIPLNIILSVQRTPLLFMVTDKALQCFSVGALSISSHVPNFKISNP
jgi:hypothetical protein